VATLDIDNPYFDPGDPSGVQQRKVKAVVALRDDPVGRMARRGHLGDKEETDSRLKAAHKWQALYEKSEIGGARGIDPSKDVVDGGRFVEPDSDSRMAAQQELDAAHKALRRELGIRAEVLIRRVLGDKYELRQVAVMNGDASAESLRALGRFFRDCLDVLAAHFRIVTTAPPARRTRDSYSDAARLAYNPELHRAARLARR
jgi:hypothetical protein